MAKANIIPIFIPHGGCKQQCIFCNQYSITGQDGLPSVEDLAAKFPDVNPEREIAFYGGSFTSLPLTVMENYLFFAAQLKEIGKIGKIRLSTHPETVNEATVAILKKYSVDTVELGVQSLDNEVLARANRGHSSVEVLQGIKLLKEAGIDLGIQLMIGLPEDSRQKIFDGIKKLLPYRPFFVRLYPLLVLEGTPLAEELKNGTYEPLSLGEAVDIVKDIYAFLTLNDVPVIRMGLQPSDELNRNSPALLGGPFHESFGYLVQCALKKAQLLSALRDITETDVKIYCPKRNIPLLYGNKGSNMKDLETQFDITVCLDDELADGDIVVTTATKKKTLTYKDFLLQHIQEVTRCI